MNKDNAKDYLPLVQALAEGKVIEQYVEIMPRKIMEWLCIENPNFSYPPEEYRIKPEPRRAYVYWPPKSHPRENEVSITRHLVEVMQWVEICGGHYIEVPE